MQGELGHLLEHMRKLQSFKAEGNTAIKGGWVPAVWAGSCRV